MTSHKDLQSLITEIDALLTKAGSRLSWVTSGDVSAQRRMLEKVRHYLASLQKKPSSERQEQLDSTPQSETAQQIVQAVVKEMELMRNSLLQPLQADVEVLRQQRESLIKEIRQIEAQRQYYNSFAQQQAKQQQLISDFLQVLTGRLQESLTQQVAQTLANLETKFLDSESVDSELTTASASPDELTTPIHPRERLQQMRQMQAECDRLLMNLDATLQAVLEALQRNVIGYQESLSQGVSKMHSLGQQGELLFTTFVNHLGQQLERENFSAVEPLQLNVENLTSTTNTPTVDNEAEKYTSDTPTAENETDAFTTDTSTIDNEAEKYTSDTLTVENETDAFTTDTSTIENEVEEYTSDTLTVENETDAFTTDTPTIENEVEEYTSDTPTVENEADAFTTDTSTIESEVEEYTSDTPTVENETNAFTTDTPTIESEAEEYTSAAPTVEDETNAFTTDTPTFESGLEDSSTDISVDNNESEDTTQNNPALSLSQYPFAGMELISASAVGSSEQIAIPIVESLTNEPELSSLSESNPLSDQDWENAEQISTDFVDETTEAQETEAQESELSSTRSFEDDLPTDLDQEYSTELINPETDLTGSDSNIEEDSSVQETENLAIEEGIEPNNISPELGSEDSQENLAVEDEVKTQDFNTEDNSEIDLEPEWASENVIYENESTIPTLNVEDNSSTDGQENLSEQNETSDSNQNFESNLTEELDTSTAAEEISEDQKKTGESIKTLTELFYEEFLNIEEKPTPSSELMQQQTTQNQETQILNPTEYQSEQKNEGESNTETPEDTYIIASPDENLLASEASGNELGIELLLNPNTLKQLSQDLSSFELIENPDVQLQQQNIVENSQLIPQEVRNESKEVETEQLPDENIYLWQQITELNELLAEDWQDLNIDEAIAEEPTDFSWHSTNESLEYVDLQAESNGEWGSGISDWGLNSQMGLYNNSQSQTNSHQENFAWGESSSLSPEDESLVDEDLNNSLDNTTLLPNTPGHLDWDRNLFPLEAMDSEGETVNNGEVIPEGNTIASTPEDFNSILDNTSSTNTAPPPTNTDWEQDLPEKQGDD